MIEIGAVTDVFGDAIEVEAELAYHSVHLATPDGSTGGFVVNELTPEAAEELGAYLMDAAAAAREARDKEEC